jgi:hypothetical protein
MLGRFREADGNVMFDAAGSVDINIAKTTFGSDPLGDIHMSAGEVGKTLDQQHRAQPPGRQDLSRAAFLEAVIPAFSYFERRQRELSKALDQALSPDDNIEGGPHRYVDRSTAELCPGTSGILLHLVPCQAEFAQLTTLARPPPAFGRGTHQDTSLPGEPCLTRH